MSLADEKNREFEGHGPSCNDYNRNGRNGAEDVANAGAKEPSVEEYKAKLHTSEGWYLD